MNTKRPSWRAQHDPPTSNETVQRTKLVESVNSLSTAEFLERFNIASSIEKTNLTLTREHHQDLTIRLFSAADMKHSHRNVLNGCFELIEQSSAEDYKASEIKWSPSKKRREMILPDMKYLVIQGRASGSTDTNIRVKGFVSFMVTYEDGLEVIYIYEIHLVPELRSQGIGKLLMGMVEGLAESVGVEKCMLTVFRANEKAVTWYHNRGYVIDDYSPQPRVLRNGSVKESSYLILSKPIKP